MKSFSAVSFACLLFAVACVEQGTEQRTEPETVENDSWHKVEFDLAQLDEQGLRGPADGKVAVAYEFSIPRTAEHKAEVQAIDPTVQFMSGSRGRIGAGEDEYLCIGSTHQEGYRGVLQALAELAYVERLIECHFE